MANQAKKQSVVSGAGLLTQVWTVLDAEVKRLNYDNHVNALHRLGTEQGKDTIRTMAKIIVADNEQSSRPGLVTDEQMAALEWYVARSPNASEYAKKAIIWMLRQTNNLACNIAVSFPFNWNEARSQEVGIAVRAINDSSALVTIELCTMFMAMGVECSIRSFHGLYESANYGSFNHEQLGFTIYISTAALFDHSAQRILADFSAIEAVDLSWKGIVEKIFASKLPHSN